MLGILLIATKKYKQFVQPLVDQLNKYIRVPFQVILFSDEGMFLESKAPVNNYLIPAYGFPQATLYRYKIFSSHEVSLRERFKHLLYLDVDMRLECYMGKEFLVPGLLCVQHPGTYESNRWGSPNTSKLSSAWFAESERKRYYCGGVQGGKVNQYLNACKHLAKNIDDDEMNGVMAEWHDETHWNKFTNYIRPDLVTELSPSYCMPEPMKSRKDWGLLQFEPKIIALEKNHKEIRL